MIHVFKMFMEKLFGKDCGGVYYIGGSDILPAPLKPEEEQAQLELIEQGSDIAKQCLIEHNLRLVVYISRRFENTGVNLEDLTPNFTFS